MDGGRGEGIGMKRRKKAGAVVLAVMLALMPVRVLGDGADTAAGENEVTARAAALALMPVRVLGGGADAAAGEIEVTARAAVAMEAETGRFLYRGLYLFYIFTQTDLTRSGGGDWLKI